MKRHEVSKCLLCNNPIDESVTWITLLSNQFPRTICSHCEDKFEPYPAEPIDKTVISLYKYNEQMKDYLHRYKFMHDVLLAKVFRHQIHQHLAKKEATIVPIPMHPEKLKERTFAHVDELLKQANIIYEHYLIKITTETQGGKTREQRINARQIFALKENQNPAGKEFILVDDIYTTGTTINQAKKILLDAKAKSVTAFTLIRR
ncbi:ComF family protein [Ureibacillus sinduriensis]|uniref:Competence protein ComFC n=1 Tax=Ureibacillus sinduriensis BLB-1 = JCM 15800 TaxID=1384057 RepID=A0A0A3I1G8_9BACL|nr:ComF family protein [Ureibacillus sinduriensis]KGR76508.1 competence protein ComFC [Ureibacillus sinduriensis BLB-1 = JCM 15800]